MNVSVRHNGKEFPLSQGKTMAIIVIFIASIVLAWYAGGFIGIGAMKAIGYIVGQAERQAEDCGCEEVKKNFIPVEVPNDAVEQQSP